MIARATAMRAMLRGAQAECEANGRVSDAINDALIRAGFYRVVQPRCFGGYEFDVPTFYRVMMEIARGCPETGWVLALTAGHPLIIANFPLEGQRDVYGATANSVARPRSIRMAPRCRCKAAIASPRHGRRRPAATSARIISAAPRSAAQTASRRAQVIQVLLTRDQYRIVDDWHVMGMQGTGSKRIVVEDVFVPAQRTVAAVGVGRGNEPAKRTGLHANPLYLGRTASFLIGEAASVAVGAARGALDLYEEVLRDKRAYHPPYHERYKRAGIPVALRPRARPDRDRRGRADPRRRGLHGLRARGGRGWRAVRRREGLAAAADRAAGIRLAWEGMELIYRTVGTSDAARDGATIGRIFRNMAVINTHPALQLDRTAINAARARFGLSPFVVAPERTRMIPRYSRPEMTAIWDPQTRFRIWFEIEAHASDAMAELGIIPKEAAYTIWEKARHATFDVARIDEIERETKHDVIAFLTHLSEIVGPEARFVHQGMTSSDVLDTCFNVQLTRAADILIADVEKLLEALKRRAFEHKMTPTIGRSHGIHAEPVTFGLKLAQAYAEFARAKDRLIAARKEVATCAISGAVGTFAQIDPRIEAHVAAKMGLTPEPISTQVIPRDRHAMFFATLGVVASSIERLAIEVRHLQRTEVLEAEEFFSAGQKGSSAMPHKRNPVLSENLTGLARMVRAYVTPALENVALWHERDISHSSVERMIGPDATVTLDFALVRLTGLIDRLMVYPENMQKNLDKLGGLIHSQRVLLALTQKGASREEAYALVQRNAMPVWRGEGDFLTFLKADKDVKRFLTDAEIETNFDLGFHLKHVDTIFRRVFGA